MRHNSVEILIGVIILIIVSILILMKADQIWNTNEQTLTQLNFMYEEVKTLREIIQSDYQIVTVTAYHPNSRGINSDAHPNKTALMKKPISGYTLAVSTELVELGWLGKKIYIDGWGVGRATDRMGKSVKGKRIDICAPSLKRAKKFGIKKNVLSIVLN